VSEPLIECVPNFSEGRRREVVDAIVAAIGSVRGVHVLDTSLDADHNRSVVTFAGPPAGVVEAAFRATAVAAQAIDLDLHRGVHPRIGAADVIPFVPLANATLADCVVLARQLGRNIGEELQIPVYLYEAAATRPERRNLADVRRGEYEGLKQSLGVDPDRQPDFGPARLGPAGATAVGARPPLIAYNIYLNTGDVDVARKIAKALRHSNGGLRYCKALGLLVGGRAQVSINMTDYRATPLQRMWELVRAEAERYGAAPVESEVVGLIPQDALLDAAEHYLRLNRFSRDQVLERRLAAVLAEEQSSKPDDAGRTV
jgi:glutamate formiminotransferase